MDFFLFFNQQYMHFLVELNLKKIFTHLFICLFIFYLSGVQNLDCIPS